MRSLVTAAVLMCIVPQLHAADPVEWRVVNVADGDTITCLDDGKRQCKARLHGIDAPELGQPFGQASKRALSDLVFGKQVTLHTTGTDRYRISSAACQAPQSTKVQAAPCHRPASSIETVRLRTVRAAPPRLPPSGM